MKVLLASLCLGLTLSTPSLIREQEPRSEDPFLQFVETLRNDLSAGKVRTIQEVMQLSVEENVKFWPIYQEFEIELFALGDDWLELVKKFAEAHVKKELDGAVADEIAKQWFELQRERLALLEAYYGILSEELSPARGAQFLQIENRVGALVDLLLASEVPFVEAPRNK